MVSDRKIWGVGILQMYYVAKREKIEGIDIASRLEAFMESFYQNGVKWCYQRNYLKDGKLTKRGLRFVKKETGDDYDTIKKIMLDILQKEK